MKHSLLKRALHQPQTREFVIVNDTLALLTIVSIIGIVLESVAGLSEYQYIFNAIEYITVVFFSLEYILRVYDSKPKTSYIFSFFGLVDLVAILPTLFGIGNLTFLKSARVLRLMRFLRIVRLAKVARVNKLRHPDLEDRNAIQKLNIEIYFASLFGAVLVLGTLIYIFESHQHNLSSIPEGMLWAIETILGGFPTDKMPETAPGRIITIVARFTGLVLLGFLINVIGNGVKKALFGTKKI